MLLAGLGTMRLTTELPELGSTLRVWVLPTPVAPWRTLARFAVAGTVPLRLLVPGVGSARSVRSVDRAASWPALQAAMRIIKQDRPVPARERHLAQPPLVPGERSIGLFRRWAVSSTPRGSAGGEVVGGAAGPAGAAVAGGAAAAGAAEAPGVVSDSQTGSGSPGTDRPSDCHRRASSA